MTRFLAATLACLVALSLASAQEASRAVNWRTVKPARAFIAASASRDEGRLEFQSAALLREFARVAGVAVRFEEDLLSTLTPLSVVAPEGAALPPMFDLCQSALHPRYALLPEGTGFIVCPLAEVASRAPHVTAADLPKLAASEWALATFPLDGRDINTLQRGLTPLRSQYGRIDFAGTESPVVVLDMGANLRRMAELIPVLDRGRPAAEVVAYQRHAQVPMQRLVQSMNLVLTRFTNLRGHPSSGCFVQWDAETGMVTGVVPREIAATFDAAIDAANDAAARRNETEARNAQFAVAVPASWKLDAFADRLRALYAIEVESGLLRIVPRGEGTATLYVRCRPWLEAEIRESIDLLSQ